MHKKNNAPRENSSLFKVRSPKSYQSEQLDKHYMLPATRRRRRRRRGDRDVRHDTGILHCLNFTAVARDNENRPKQVFVIHFGLAVYFALHEAILVGGQCQDDIFHEAFTRRREFDYFVIYWLLINMYIPVCSWS